jgi:hypothetical protein
VGLVEKVQATEFLGREFATWLYWLSFKGNGTVSLDGLDPFELWFESPVELVNDYGDATSVLLKGSTPLESPEALRAFRENKKIQRAHIRLNYRNSTWTFGFHAGRFLISGLRLPLPSTVTSGDYLVVRFQLLDEFDKFWEGLLEKFLAVRFDEKAWRAQRKQIESMIAEAAADE